MTLDKELRGTLDKSSSDIVTNAIETDSATVNGRTDTNTLEADDTTINESLVIGFSPLEVGDGASVSDTASRGIAIGENASVPDGDSIAIGDGTTAKDTSTLVIGQGASATVGSFALGNGAKATTATSLALGNVSTINGGSDNVAIGSQATAGSSQSVAVGFDSYANSYQATAVGDHADASGAQASVALGQSVNVSTDNVGRVGVDQWVFGGVRDTISDADLNNNEVTVELDETNNAFRLRGKDSSGIIREATVSW